MYPFNNTYEFLDREFSLSLAEIRSDKITRPSSRKTELLVTRSLQ